MNSDKGNWKMNVNYFIAQRPQLVCLFTINSPVNMHTCNRKVQSDWDSMIGYKSPILTGVSGSEVNWKALRKNRRVSSVLGETNWEPPGFFWLSCMQLWIREQGVYTQVSVMCRFIFLLTKSLSGATQRNLCSPCVHTQSCQWQWTWGMSWSL